MKYFEKWLDEMVESDTDLSLELDLVLEFIRDEGPESRMILEEWFIDVMDCDVNRAHDVMYRAGHPEALEAAGWIAEREMLEFAEWLKRHDNQNWEYADISK